MLIGNNKYLILIILLFIPTCKKIIITINYLAITYRLYIIIQLKKKKIQIKII